MTQTKFTVSHALQPHCIIYSCHQSDSDSHSYHTSVSTVASTCTYQVYNVYQVQPQHSVHVYMHTRMCQLIQCSTAMQQTDRPRNTAGLLLQSATPINSASYEVCQPSWFPATTSSVGQPKTHEQLSTPPGDAIT